MLPWMATGAVPVRIRTATHFSLENSHRETSHRGRTFHPPWAFVGFTATLRYEPCTQFINVSQRTRHIYELTAVQCVRWTHSIKIERNNLLCEQAPTGHYSTNLHCSLLVENYSITVATRPDPTVRPPSRYQTGVLRYTNSDFLCDLCGKIRIFRCVRVVFRNFCYHGVITVFLVFLAYFFLHS